MASPQKENGFTSIANEILERLCFAGITGSEYRILLFVIRKTYGFQKKKDRISFTQFQKGTGMNRAHAIRTIQSLVHKGILVKENNSYSFNKNWEQWVVHKRVPSTQLDTTASTRLDTKGSTQSGTYKRKKETITKETSGEAARTSKVKYTPLGAEVLRAFEVVDPKNKSYYANTTQRAACDFLIEEYGFKEVKKRISFLPQSNKLPYFPSITTPFQLKEKWVQLQNRVEQYKQKRKDKVQEII